MSANLLGELAANNGTYFLHNESYVGSFDQIIVRGKGVEVNNIYSRRDGQLVDVTEEYLSTNLVADGLRITPKNNEVFTEIRVRTTLQYIGVELVLSA